MQLPPVVQPDATNITVPQQAPTPNPGLSTPSLRSMLTAEAIEKVRSDARNNVKTALFSRTLLPNAVGLSEMVRTALYNAAVGHLGGKFVPLCTSSLLRVILQLVSVTGLRSTLPLNPKG